jgi:hypothetical protein
MRNVVFHGVALSGWRATSRVRVMLLLMVLTSAVAAKESSFAVPRGAVWPRPVLQAASSSQGAQGEYAKKPKKAKKAKGKGAAGVTFYEGSGETRAERDRRLTRECRGRANSGLCEGYGRP